MKKSYILLGASMLLMPMAMRGQAMLSPRTAIVLNGGTDCAQRVKGQNAADQKTTVFVTIDPAQTSWQQLGITPIAECGNTATARLSMAELKALAQEKGVKYLQITSTVNQTLDVARKEAGIDDIHNGVSLPQPYTGKGVVVGVVDAGFDYLHSAFRNPEDGSLRIKRVWEQNTSAKLDGAKAPEKFGYGIELNTPELIQASKADMTDNSHGSHVTGIAAGSDSFNNGAYVGNAPDADIVLVALDMDKCNSADICNGVKYIFDYADEVGKPCVVNLSLNTQDGPHDGTSTFDTMTDEMQKAGRLLVGAAGNHRTDKFHIAHNFESADDAALKTTVVYKVSPSSYTGGQIEIWGEKGADFTVEMSALNLRNKTNGATATVYPEDGVSEVTLGNYMSGKWNVASEINPLNGKPHVVLTSAVTSVRSGYAIALTITPKSKGRVDIWADNTYLGLSSHSIEGFTDPDASMATIGEVGGTGKKIITVGSYNTNLVFGSSAGDVVGGLSSYSGYGPTVDGRIKPDVTAPGSVIVSAGSKYDNSSMVAATNSEFGRDNNYVYMQGTSMASPFVVGIVATWLQAYPQLTPEQLHEIVDATARKDEFVTDVPNNDWGYGKINAMDGLKKCIDYGASGVEAVDMPFDGSIRIVDGNVAVSFLRAANASVRVSDLSGHTLMNKQLGKKEAGDTAVLPMPSLDKGVYVVTVRTNYSTNSYKFVAE